jgi:hypothetical protein
MAICHRYAMMALRAAPAIPLEEARAFVIGARSVSIFDRASGSTSGLARIARTGPPQGLSRDLLIRPAAAHAQPGKLSVHVTGGADCALWLAARQQHGSEILEQYVVGMLDGLSSGADREFWQADGRQ